MTTKHTPVATCTNCKNNFQMREDYMGTLNIICESCFLETEKELNRRDLCAKVMQDIHDPAEFVRRAKENESALKDAILHANEFGAESHRMKAHNEMLIIENNGLQNRIKKLEEALTLAAQALEHMSKYNTGGDGVVCYGCECLHDAEQNHAPDCETNNAAIKAMEALK